MLSDEEKKARKKAYLKAYREKNREKINAQKKAYYQENVEKIKAYNQENAEKIKAYWKAYYQENAEKHKKFHTIANWKRYGLICDDYDKLYELYLQSTHCEECGCKYSDFGDGVGKWRCMDHCHTTGLFRNFLCHTCNIRRG